MESKLRFGKQVSEGVDASILFELPRGTSNITRDGEDEIKVLLGGRGQSVRIPASIVYGGNTETSGGFELIKQGLIAVCGKNSLQGSKIVPNMSYEADFYTVDFVDELAGARFINVVFDSLSLNASLDSDIKLSMAYFASKGRNYNENVIGTTKLNQGDDILSYLDIEVHWKGNNITRILNGFTIEFSNSTDVRKYNTLGSREYQVVRLGDLSLVISATGLYLDNSLQEDLWGGTETGGKAVEDILLIKFKNPSNPTESIDISGLAKLTRVDKNTPVNDTTSLDIAFDFIYDEGKLIDITINGGV